MIFAMEFGMCEQDPYLEDFDAQGQADQTASTALDAFGLWEKNKKQS